MSQSDDNHGLSPVGIDIPPEIRLYVVQLLNQTLACTVDLRSQVKQACWNVKGHDVVLLHALFATMAIELDAHIDLVAERLVVLGGVARGTVRTAATHSRLPEYPGAIMDGDAHVRALTECFASYATALRADITHATEVEEAGSAALYTDISRGVDTRLGFLEAYLHRDGARREPTRHNGRRAE
ncbi:MAG TPA: DNA starvation/stationary phase protection protein Dps [Candidatus Saccharimonadia bacterium]|nr:DNA starvation/stationary phase protection protein Dps [Candidatus Saccharimonadia bacterium]